MSDLHKRLKNDRQRRAFLKQMAAIAGAGALAGCTGEESDQTDTPTVTSGDGSDDTTATATQTSSSSSDLDATLDLNVVQRFGTIDPAKGTDYTQLMAITNVYDPLLFPGTAARAKPHVATDWSIGEDKKTYTFELRDDITFHSGNRLTAEDVKFTVDRFLAINQGFSSLFADVLNPEKVTVEGDHRISFELNKVYSPFLSILVTLFIVDKQAVMNNLGDGEFGDLGDYGQDYLLDNDAGSGPYELKALERGSQLRLEQYPDYWMGFLDGAFEAVRAVINSQDPTVRSLMKSGELDFTSPFQSQETYDALSGYENTYVEAVPSPTVFMFKINTQKPPVDDVEVRKALAWGFDYETAIKEIAGGSPQAVGPLPPFMEVHNPDIPQPTYDPDRAQQILADAGYAEGDVKINNTYVEGYGLEEKLGLLFQDKMQDIGIEVELNPQTWGTMTELATDPEKTPHTNQVFFSPIYPSPDAYFFNQYYSGSANSWMSMEHLNNQEVDSLFEESRKTIDRNARNQLYLDLQQEIAELYSDIFIFVQETKHGFAKGLKHKPFPFPPSYYYWYRNYFRA